MREPLIVSIGLLVLAGCGGGRACPAFATANTISIVYPRIGATGIAVEPRLLVYSAVGAATVYLTVRGLTETGVPTALPSPLPAGSDAVGSPFGRDFAVAFPTFYAASTYVVSYDSKRAFGCGGGTTERVSLGTFTTK